MEADPEGSEKKKEIPDEITREARQAQQGINSDVSAGARTQDLTSTTLDMGGPHPSLHAASTWSDRSREAAEATPLSGYAADDDVEPVSEIYP